MPGEAEPGVLAVGGGAVLHGAFDPPGDKSITHRAFLFGAIAKGETRVGNANPGADCEATLACVRMLGARAARDGDAVVLTGTGGAQAEPASVLACGNSGTTLRLLAGVVAAGPGLAVLDGDASLRARPMRRIVEPLRRMGATVLARDHDTRPPLVVRGAVLDGIEHDADVASAQVLACVVLAGLGARGRTSVAIPGPARDHTERMLPLFGVDPRIEREGAGTRVTVEGPASLAGASIDVPGDPSAAAFFLAAAAAVPGARVTARRVSVNPTRAGFLDLLERMGARVFREDLGTRAGDPVADVTVEGPARLDAVDVPAAWLPRLVDEVPAWSIAAAAAHGTSRLDGAAELRVKESDRLALLARGLASFGVRVEERPDGLVIGGAADLGRGVVDAAGDHRIAMAFAVLGAIGRGVTVRGAEGIATSYPGFVEALRALGGRIEEGA